MIPDIKDCFPVVFHDDPNCDILCNKFNSILLSIFQDILKLGSSFDPMRCKSPVLDVLAHMVNADLDDEDDQTQKRKKILNAVQNNKFFGTWVQNKTNIDIICGGSSSIVQGFPMDDWILCGSKDDGSYIDTCSVLGGKDTDTEYGIKLMGSKLTYQKGIIYINVDSDNLTSQQIEQLKKKMSTSIPVGMEVHFGYISNDFIDYFVLGEINAN